MRALQAPKPQLPGQTQQVLQERRIGSLDLTGGAPELNPHFRALVTAR